MDAAPPPAVVASPPRGAASCLPQPYRWQDRCDEGSGGLKHVALDGDDDVWLTVGGELRKRVETIDQPEFGTRRAPGYTANDIRALVEADLRTAAGPRLFVQLAAAADDGRVVVRSFDRSAPDIQQAFVDLPFRAGGLAVTARIGRQEVDLGDDRLVASREPAPSTIIAITARPSRGRASSLARPSPVGRAPPSAFTGIAGPRWC